ncbi:Histidine protein kinase NIK1 [Paraphaeosphaeria sporulosa]
MLLVGRFGSITLVKTNRAPRPSPGLPRRPLDGRGTRSARASPGRDGAPGLNPLKTEEGRFVIPSIIDSTERHHNEQLQAQVDVAKAANPRQSRLPSDDEPRAPHPAHCVRPISLGAIVPEILDFTKIEAGLFNIEDIDFELTSEVDMVVQPFTKVALACLRLQQPRLVGRAIIVNPVENAIKFTEVGEIEIAVRAPEHNHDRRWQFVIRHTGIGIEVTARKKLFEPFMQAEYPRRANSAERDRAKAMPPCSSAAVKPKPDPFTRTRRPLSILVAEDNEVIQVLVGRMLERMGHRAVCVGDGYAALQAVKRGGYDLVLMDMHMPIIDGTEATRCIRQLDGVASTIPVIALTADAMLDHRKRYYEAGIDELLTKAINPGQLRASLDRIERAVAEGATSAALKGERADAPPDAMGENAVQKSFGSFQDAVS